MMWVLSGNGQVLINLDMAKRIFINEVSDAALIGVELCHNGDRIAPMGKYHDRDTAEKILREIGLAIGDGREYYIMPDNCFDVVVPKTMDSRVKRRGGS